ncbi:MAG: hypothetical protein CMM93_08765 [Rickettsiales bacterium]|nr:hypothetical protein [Rickettsiales bacterium]
MLIRILCLIAAGILVSGCSGPQSVLASHPMQFPCPQFADYITEYDHRSFADIQKYAEGPPTNSVGQFGEDLLLSGNDTATVERVAAQAAAPVKMLILSGGGQWGAFGAGFLNAQAPADRNFDVVTGVSTGAIQALFVGANQYERMQYLYGLPEGNPASANGMIGLISKGSQHDLSALRKMLRDELYGRGKDSLLTAILDGKGAPNIRIAMVEGRSNNLMIVDLSGYIRAKHPLGTDRSGLSEKDVGDCVTGLVLASSAIPLRLTPVQIDIGDENGLKGDFRTFMDGGVRLSIIDRQFAQLSEDIYLMQLCSPLGAANECTLENLKKAEKSGLIEATPPSIYVVRNGPTVVPKSSLDAHIDTDPDAYVTAMRGYAILVNQNEVASIGEMQARYPYDSLNVVSADGYNWMSGQQVTWGVSHTFPCPERDEGVYFDKAFMECLIAFGHWRKANYDADNNGWQQLAPLIDEPQGLAEEGPVLPSEAALKRAEKYLPAR